MSQGAAAPQPPAPRRAHLWTPEHSMHSSTPRLMLAQRGSGWPQSPHRLLPATLCTRCSTLSPLALRSRESVAESMLLVDGDAVRSSLWGWREGPLSPRSSSLPRPGAPPARGPARLGWLKHEPACPCVPAYSHAHSGRARRYGRSHCTRMCTRAACRDRPPAAHRRVLTSWRVLRGPHLTVAAVWALPVGGGNAGLHGLKPGLPQLLGVGLQHAAPGGGGHQARRAGLPPPPCRGGPPHLVGDTTSKQNLRSMSSHGFTEHRRRSSTTTVSTSCGQHRHGLVPSAQHHRGPVPSAQPGPTLTTRSSLYLCTQTEINSLCPLTIEVQCPRPCPTPPPPPPSSPPQGPGGEGPSRH